LKRAHSDEEIGKLAEKFRESWSEGQVIRSWLRRHSEELRKLVREEDWSWTNIGKALSAAGIQYNTDRGWTGENVRRAVDLAMKPRKARGRKSATTPFAPTAPVSSPVTPVLASAAPKAGGEPEFRIIRRGPGAPVRAEAGGTPSESSKQGEP
jgi:hypothetical protein